MGNMDKYKGKVCPYCKTEFKEDDDIVICSACEMPHHKECWVENKGCTTFGCLGTIKSAPGSAPIAETVPMPSAEPSVNRFCPRCGSPVTPGNLYCGSCGSPVAQVMQPQYQPVYQPAPPQQNGYSYAQPQQNQPYGAAGQQYYGGAAYMQSDRERLIGAKAQYYMQKFDDMKRQNKTSGWNWCAFLVSPFWMLYRKMYAYGVGILFLIALLMFARIPGLIMLVPYIIIGIFGNYLYMQQIEKHENALKTLAEAEKESYIAKNGGTSTTAVIIGVAANILMSVLIL